MINVKIVLLLVVQSLSIGKSFSESSSVKRIILPSPLGSSKVWKCGKIMLLLTNTVALHYLRLEGCSLQSTVIVNCY